MSEISQEILDYIAKNEGLRLSMYKCPAGKLTIGYGHNLQDVPITKNAALCILRDDLKNAQQDAEKIFSNFNEIYSENIKKVILDMIFNLGYAGFSKFKNMIAALKRHDYYEAAQHAKDSLWYKQVGNRSKENVNILLNESRID